MVYIVVGLVAKPELEDILANYMDKLRKWVKECTQITHPIPFKTKPITQRREKVKISISRDNEQRVVH
jgi:hypothetical protein